MRKNSCPALLSCSDKVPCPEFIQSLTMRENCTTHLEHVHRFSLHQTVGRSVGSAGNGVMGWSDWMAHLRTNAALYTCCVSSNTPLWLSSSKHTISSPTLFFSFLCLVQPQTSLNTSTWPRLYFTAEHILRLCTLVTSVKDQSHVKVPFDHVTRALQTVPSDIFSCTWSRSNLPHIRHMYNSFCWHKIGMFVRMYSASRTSGWFWHLAECTTLNLVLTKFKVVHSAIWHNSYS